MQTELYLSMSGAHPRKVVQAWAEAGWLPSGDLRLQADAVRQRGDDLDVLAAVRSHDRVLAISNSGHTLRFDAQGVVSLQRPQTEVTEGLREMLSAMPFELAVIGQLFPQWWDANPPTWSFGDGHVPHGWASAFQGAGFSRLVSRRWLDQPQWQLVQHGQSTWVEFHALDADPMAALAPAIRGWERLGISDSGGFIQTGFVFTEDVGGVYDAAERKLKLMVRDDVLSQRRMLEIAALRGHPGVPASQPIERTAFVFLRLEDARRHLRELWLRGHECWAIVNGLELRLDGEQAPPD